MPSSEIAIIEPIQRALGAFLPTFALLREDRAEGPFIGDNTDAQMSFEPIVENGISLEQAVAFLVSGCKKKYSRSSWLHIGADGYHLIAASPDETSAAGTDLNSLMRVVSPVMV